jgi:hypothetical protein
MPPVHLLSETPASLEKARCSIDVHWKHIDRKRIHLPNKGLIDEQGNHGHIVSRLLKAFGSPLCAFSVVMKTLDTMMDIIDTQPLLVSQLVENDICLLLVSWLGQAKRNTSSEIPVKILQCISKFLVFSVNYDEVISQHFVDGFLFENLGIIFDIFKEENYVLLYTGRILRQLAASGHIYEDPKRAPLFLESIVMIMLERNLGATILFDYCYGVKDWNRIRISKKTEPIIQKIVDSILSIDEYVRSKTIRQFLSLVIVSSYPTLNNKSNMWDVTESLYLSRFKWSDKKKEVSTLIDVTLQCFLDCTFNPRLIRVACGTLSVLLQNYYETMAHDKTILLYSLHHPICEAMIKVLTSSSGHSLKLTLAVLQIFVLLFPQGCHFRKQLLRSEFIRINDDDATSCEGCGCGMLPPSGVRIVVDSETTVSHLLMKWLPLLEAAQVRCLRIRQKHFRLFLQNSSFSPSLQRGKFPSISLIFSNLYVSSKLEKNTGVAMKEVFFSKLLCDNISSYL